MRQGTAAILVAGEISEDGTDQGWVVRRLGKQLDSVGRGLGKQDVNSCKTQISQSYM